MENVKSVRASVKERVAAGAVGADADAPFSGMGGGTHPQTGNCLGSDVI